DRGDDGTAADRRHQVELVHEPTGAGQAETEAAGGGVAVGEGKLHIGYARTFVGEDEPDPAPEPVAHRLDLDVPAAAVGERVAGQLARRRDELRLVDEAELGRHRGRPYQLAHADDVVVGRDGQALRGAG